MRTESHVLTLPDGHSATFAVSGHGALDDAVVTATGDPTAIPPELAHRLDRCAPVILELLLNNHAAENGASLVSSGEGLWVIEDDLGPPTTS